MERWPGNLRGITVFDLEPELLEAAAEASPIKIECADSETLYKMVGEESKVDPLDMDLMMRFGRGIFRPNKINDSLIRSEMTVLGGSKSGIPNLEPELRLHTTINLTEIQRQLPNYGYYNFSRVEAIRGHLAEAGIPSVFSQDIQYNNYLKIPLGYSLEARLRFGSDSRDAEEAMIRWEERRDINSYGRILDSTKRDLHKMKEGLVNKSIILELTRPRPYATTGIGPSLESLNKFISEFDLYKKILPQILGALYKEAQLPVPELLLRWQSIFSMLFLAPSSSISA